MLHITPLGIPILTWAGIGYITGFCALVSFLVPVAHALATYALDNSPRAQERRRPELSYRSIDIMLGKRPGYLSQHRSTLRTYQWLAQRGLKKQHLRAMTADELSELRAKLEEKESKPRKGTFHRGDRIPAEGIRVMDTGGPNVVVVCSSKEWKQRVLRCLKQLMKEVRAA